MNTPHDRSEEQGRISQGLKIFGDAYVLAIVGVLARTGQRFNDLQRALGNISPTTLTSKLKKLEQFGLVIQEKQAMDQLTVVYTLTEKGKKMLPVLGAIEAISKKIL
jgi:DNA-binding HxlR family transcriptional regulator